MFISSDISADELTIHSPHMQFRYLPIVAALMLAFSGSSTQAETYSHTYDQQDISGNIEIDVDSVPIYSDVDLTIRDSTVEGYVAVGDFNAASNGSATISISDSSLGSLFVSGPDRAVTANNLHISQATHWGTSAYVKGIGIVYGATATFGGNELNVTIDSDSTAQITGIHIFGGEAHFASNYTLIDTSSVGSNLQS